MIERRQGAQIEHGARAFPASARAFLRRATARLAEAPLARRRQASVECPREADVFEAVAFGRWPAQSSGDLHAHVAGCAVCRDLVDVAGALHDDRHALMREAQPPSAGAVWWRATIRARAEAARTAMQPITLWQGIAAACVAGVVAALGGSVWHWSHATSRLGDLISGLMVNRADGAGLASFGFEHALVVLLGLAACLVLAPLALYFTLADD